MKAEDAFNLLRTEGKEMGLAKIAEAGVITWLFGGGVLMFIVVLVLLKAC